MADVLVVAYLSLWALTSVGLIVSSRWLMCPWRPARHPVAVSLVAGAVWPLLLFGAAQFAAVVVAAEAFRSSHEADPQARFQESTAPTHETSYPAHV